MKPSLEEINPDVPPVCAGCGNEVNPKFASVSDDFTKLYCGFCAPEHDLAERRDEVGAESASHTSG